MRIGLGQYDGSFNKDSSFYMGGILFSAGVASQPAYPNDILICCIADALLGAAALGGLSNYPDKEKIIDSDFLRKIERDIHYRHHKIGNIDVAVSTSIREIEMKLTEMHAQLIAWLYLKSEQFNIKIIPNTGAKLEKNLYIKITAVALLNDRS